MTNPQTTNIRKLNPNPPTDHKWKNRGDMTFEYHSDAEQRLNDLESGKAEITPDEDSAIRKLFMDRRGIKDPDAINEAVKKDNERIAKKLEAKNRF